MLLLIDHPNAVSIVLTLIFLVNLCPVVENLEKFKVPTTFFSTKKKKNIFPTEVGATSPTHVLVLVLSSPKQLCSITNLVVRFSFLVPFIDGECGLAANVLDFTCRRFTIQTMLISSVAVFQRLLYFLFLRSRG